MVTMSVRAVVVCAIFAAAWWQPQVSAATLGVDVAGAVSKDTWDCLAKAGRSFAIVRAWHSYGEFDSDSVNTIKSAWSAGMRHVDVYLFPCPSKSAAAQVNGTYHNLDTNKVKFGMMWFDIEINPSDGCHWSSDLSRNCKYMSELIAAAEAVGNPWGIYSSHYEWENVMGLDCTVGKNFQLWDAHYDGKPTGDFVPYAGWTKAAMKQYSGTSKLCDREIDLDAY
ncbi:uncharacterized protein MONBRDRAFT_18455 [Monosiga brevicollis MX1]|uniref:Lysozyme n=1 Tax=Monosiga brevicollis TaxID=81824 RepID=A9UVV3_MONBE|nr:uncharacterized protein MONBRDRAFT_18455 [Monosiga brevicollis MX1]EDQ90455.1 predicted protein [Monosiga brevicollis MX1]|eukprot:XP_001744506.1 hypothetical protein [Monosiga brevicollis MX1]